jgi:NAD(P)-dependent dehydrogenase (short-subunit alcohol dehydrogenase family)
VSLDGKVALVTGASRGIGLAIARAFTDAGARVMITARHSEPLEAAAATLGGAEWLVANAGREEDAAAAVAACIERLGRLDILVNNAATNPYAGDVIDLDRPRAEKILQVNVLGPLTWAQEAWRAWMREHGGVILNVASTGAFAVERQIGFYDLSKLALVQLTRQLAMELGPSTRVVAIAPGLVRTEMSRMLWDGHEAAWNEKLPLQRIGEPDDIGRAALFLVGDDGAWITGHCLTVDGGELVIGGG